MKMMPRPAVSPGTARRHPAAYTLLEIALVVAIIVLLVGATVPLVSGFTREQRLREVARELLVLAKTARTDAMTTGRVAEVVFGRKALFLRRGGEEKPTEKFKLPRGMEYALRPLGAEKLLRPDDQAWIFRPSGLCQPLAVRVTEGEAWLEVEFDPLTASLSGESYFIP
ncbi:MAG: pilus assembly FimT family protein [Chthoniobacterales bacterium]|jgi:hypothetical protein